MASGEGLFTKRKVGASEDCIQSSDIRHAHQPSLINQFYEHLPLEKIPVYSVLVSAILSSMLFEIITSKITRIATDSISASLIA